MPLPSEDPQLWAVGIRLEDMDGPFGAFMHEVAIDWHRTGKLVDLEKKWGIKSTPYLVEMHEKLKAGS